MQTRSIPTAENIWGYLTRLIGMTNYESELVDQCISWFLLGPLRTIDPNCGKGSSHFRQNFGHLVLTNESVVVILLPRNYPARLESAMTHDSKPSRYAHQNICSRKHVYPNLLLCTSEEERKLISVNQTGPLTVTL